MTVKDLSQRTLLRCQECINGGKNIFPDCLDFNPIKECYYFDDISDDDPTDEIWDCPAYMSAQTYNSIKQLIK